MGDIDFSPYSGAQNILTLHQSLEKAFSYVIPHKQEKKAIYAILRILELGFIWGPLARSEMVVQHEVFGHGYRIRDIGKAVTGCTPPRNNPSNYGGSFPWATAVDFTKRDICKTTKRALDTYRG